MENENVVPLTREVEKKPRTTYSREFLLSLSELDVCKKLPSGFNESILSELGDGDLWSYVKQKNVGSLRSEYASHPQNRFEGSGNNVRGNQSRWETRSTGSSDKDADSQSAVSQDPGRRFGNQTRRWQNPKNTEHDGLLGSGAFPRPAGFTVPRSRGNGSYQLSRTTEPYQPPRPYKAVPYSRKDHTDSFNDETFGSAECSSEDRAEEEKIRRASFELMRKEQHKIHQDKQKQSGLNRKVNHDSDLTALLGNPLEDKPQSDSSSTSTTTTSHAHTPAPRPLIPPGFSSALVEKKLPVQFSSASLPSEVGNAAIEDKVSKAISQLSTDATGKLVAPLSTEVLEQKVDPRKISGKAAVQEANEVWEDDIVIINDFSCKKEKKPDVKDTLDLGHSTTVIEKLFSSAKVSNSAYSLEHQIVEAEKEILGSAIIESSKFSQRFSHEEKKPEDDFSSKELLSLIVNKEKDTEGIFDSIITPQTPPTPVPSFLVDMVSEQYSESDNKNKIASSAVLTCEDLEQSILAEVKETSQNVHHFDANSEIKKEKIDDSASNLLLSLLHKGTALQGSESPKQDTVESRNKFSNSVVNPSFDASVSTTNSCEQTLTLESLFGASFMNALHSAEAPVSARTGGTGVNNLGAQEGQALEVQLPEEDSLISVSDSLTSLENTHNTYGLMPQNGNIEDQNTLLNAIFGDGARAPEGSTRMQKGPLEMIDPNEIYHHVHRPGSQFPHHIDQAQSMLSNPHFDNLANRNQQMKFAGLGGMHHEHHLLHGNHAQHQNVFGKNGGARFDTIASHHPMLQHHMQVPEEFSPHQAMHGYPRGGPVPVYAPEINNVHNFPLQSAIPSYGAHGTRLPGLGAGVGGTHPEALERLFEMEMQARNNTNQQINHHYSHINSHFPGTHLPENMNIRYR